MIRIRTSTTLCLMSASILLAGCKTLDTITQAGTSALVATGTISSSQATSINKSASAVGNAFDAITPSQEYYIGRTVAATVLSKNKAYTKMTPNNYLNKLGQSLALFSERPETFRGYHFLIMETEEINAFAAPGGLILVSRGLLRCCKSEDELAAVLAHEIAHVAQKHGLKAIKASRATAAVTTLTAEAGKTIAGEQLAELTKNFEDSISDIVSTMVNNGYSRDLEESADAGAVKTMVSIGYDPNALVTMLEQMKKNLKPDGKDFKKTHPSPDDRIAAVRKLITLPPVAVTAMPAARARRFNSAVGTL